MAGESGNVKQMETNSEGSNVKSITNAQRNLGTMNIPDIQKYNNKIIVVKYGGNT